MAKPKSRTPSEKPVASTASLPRLPSAPRSIQAGSSLSALLDRDAIDCLIHNLSLVHPGFDGASFRKTALTGLKPLAILGRGHHLARALRAHLPQRYEDAVEVLVRSLTPPLPHEHDLGLAVFFYLPHVSFVAAYGLEPEQNAGSDPFEVSMKAQYELTRRFTAEFSMRPFLIRWSERTLARLLEWTRDPDPHVRRLCSEATRPRLPWAPRIPAFIRDPRPTLPILEALKDDPVIRASKCGQSPGRHRQGSSGTHARDLPEMDPRRFARTQMAHSTRPALSGPQGNEESATASIVGEITDRGRGRVKLCPSLQTGRADFPHPAFQSVGS